MFPDGGPNPTPASMNYTVVINMAVWGGALAYYYIDARKWFTGPKITVDVEGMSEGQIEELAAEGLDLGSGEGVIVGGGKGKVKGVDLDEKKEENSSADSA